MRKLRQFIVTASLGGLFVILPVVILVQIGQWLYALFIDTASPLIALTGNTLNTGALASELLALALVFALCFALGLVIRTRVGGWLHDLLERGVLTHVPGYKTVRDIVSQFGGKRQRLFREVVLVSFSDHGPAVTGFVVDEYGDNRVTVFVPTGPNPTTGLILHVTRDRLMPVDASVEQAMKTILSCGAGTGNLLNGRTPYFT